MRARSDSVRFFDNGVQNILGQLAENVVKIMQREFLLYPRRLKQAIEPEAVPVRCIGINDFSAQRVIQCGADIRCGNAGFDEVFMRDPMQLKCFFVPLIERPRLIGPDQHGPGRAVGKTPASFDRPGFRAKAGRFKIDECNIVQSKVLLSLM